MKKLNLFLSFSIIILLSISFISALDIDNVKYFDEDKPILGEIVIKNALGLPDWLLGGELARYTITSHTSKCLINCYTEGTAIFNEKDKLFRNIKFYNDKNKVKNIPYKLYIESIRNITWEEDTYDTICSDITNNNGTETICNTVVNGTISKSMEEIYWEEYNGKILDKGTYKWRLEGKKSPHESIDFIPEAFGKTLDEWAWWDGDWGYKKQTFIQENSGITQINYSVKLNVTYSANMNSDFSDLRFTNGAEDTEYGYWIESKVNSASAIVWVKVPSLTASANTTIYMYYGNAGASTTSNRNGTNVFLIFDDFDDASINTNYWTSGSSCSISVTETGGELKISGTTSGNGDIVNCNGRLESKTNYDASGGKGMLAEFMLRIASSNNGQGQAGFTASNGLDAIVGGGTWTQGCVGDMSVTSHNRSHLQNLIYGGPCELEGIGIDSNYHKRALWQNQTDYGYTRDSGIFNKTFPGVRDNWNLVNASIKAFARVSGNSIDARFDNYTLRAYIDPEPTYVFGAETSPYTGPAVVLNSPADNYKTNISLVTFNATATAGTGAAVSNISLWDNSTGVWKRNKTEIVTGSYCYQESANTTNQGGEDGSCSLDYSGSYINGSGYVDVTYKKPSEAVFSTLKLKIGNSTNSATNQTINIPDSCFNADPAELKIRLNATFSSWSSFTRSQVSCYNGTDYENITRLYNTWVGGSASGGGFGNHYLIYDGNWATKAAYEPNGANAGRWYTGGSANPDGWIYEEGINWFISTTTYNTIFNNTIPEGSTLWGVETCDSDNACAFSENRTLTLDTTYPTITIYSPSNGSRYTTTSITYNYTFSDANLDSNWTNSFNYCYQESANVTNQGGFDGSCNLNYTGLYTSDWDYFPQNSYDGSWATQTQAGDAGDIININYTAPNTNYSLSSSKWKVADSSTTELSLSSCQLIGTTLPLRVRASGDKVQYTHWECWTGSDYSTLRTADFGTGLATLYEEGIYWAINNSITEGENIFIVYVNDTFGNVNSSQVTFFIDTIKPSIKINTPINNTKYGSKSISLNITSSDLNLDKTFYSLNGASNITYTAVTTINATEGTNTLIAYANDTYGNINETDLLTFFVDTTKPIITITSPTGNLGFLSIPYNISLNYTATDINLDSCWYNSTFNATTTPLASCNNITILINSPSLIQTIYVYANDTLGNTNYSYSSWSLSGIATNETYSQSTYETSTENFYINMTYNSSLTALTAKLNYDGTNYSAINLGSGNNAYFKVTLDIPTIASITNKSFYWLINDLPLGTEIQEVKPIKIQYCNATFNLTSLNFTFYDETTLAVLPSSSNTSIEAYFTYWIGSGAIYKNYSFQNLSSTYRNFAFCITPNIDTIKTDLKLDYGATDYLDREFYLEDTTLSNTTTNYNLYLLSNTLGTKFFHSVRREVDAVPNVLVSVQKFLTGLGIYKEISVRKTDINGQFVEWLEQDKEYKYVITQNNETLATIDRTAICSVAPCEIILQISVDGISPIGELEAYFADYVDFNLNYSKSEKMVYLTFEDLLGTAHYWRMHVYKPYGNNESLEEICNITSYSVSGSMSCNTSDYYGDIVARVYISRSPEKLVDFLTFVNEDVTPTLGLSGLIASIIILLVIIFAGARNPTNALVMIPFGLTILKFIGFLPLSWGWIGAITLFIVLIMNKMRV